jgi:hypothetical protein
VSVPTRTFDTGEREERPFDAVTLSQKAGAGKGAYASPATIAAALRGLGREDRDRFLGHYDHNCAGWLINLVNGAAR